MGDSTSKSEIDDDDARCPCNTTSAVSGEHSNANEASPPVAVTKQETLSCDELKDGAMVSTN